MQLKELIAGLQEIEDKTPNKEVFVEIYDKKRDEYEINKNSISGEYEPSLDRVMLYVLYNTGNVVLGVCNDKQAQNNECIECEPDDTKETEMGNCSRYFGQKVMIVHKIVNNVSSVLCEVDGKQYAMCEDGCPIYAHNEGEEVKK